MKLTDTWSLKGTKYEDFAANIRELTSATYTVKLMTSQITMLSLLGQSPKYPDDLITSVYSANPEGAHKCRVSIPRIKGKYGEALFNEFEKNTHLMLRLGNLGTQASDTYFTSKMLSRDLAARANLAGDAVYEPSDARDAYIMERYIKHPQEVIAVIRTDGAAQKMFALKSDEYNNIEQTVLMKMADELVSKIGDFNCEGWYIDHTISQVWLSFPTYAADICATYHLPDCFVPCVLLETSSTGDCSLRAVAMWMSPKHKACFARLGKFEKPHRGTWHTDVVLDNMSAALMGRYTELPQRLAELLTIDVDDSAAAIEAVFKLTHAEKRIGKRRAIQLCEALQDEVASMPTMTAYELTVLLMEAPARLVANEFDNRWHEELETIVGEVPYLDWLDIADSVTRPAVVLTA